MKRVLVALGLMSLALSACGANTGGNADDGKGPIVLGFAIGETGFMASYDLPALEAARMAVKDINAKGGIDGRKLEIVTSNTKSEADLGGNAATAVISDGADIVVVSGDFDMGVGAASVAQAQGKLVISAGAASTAFGPTGIGDLAFTMAAAAPVGGSATAEFGYEQGWRNAYTLLDDTIQFTKEATAGFEKTWTKLGGKVVGKNTFKQSDPSVAAQISAIKRLPSPPDVIWVASYNPGLVAAIKQIRAAGLSMPIIGTEDLDGDTWKDALPNASNLYYSTYGSIYGDDPEQEINDLVARYQTEVGKKPDTAQFVLGYVAVQAIERAINEAGGVSDGAKLAKAMESFNGEKFAVPVTFSKDDHITFSRSLRVMKVDAGKTSFVETITPTDVPRVTTK